MVDFMVNIFAQIADFFLDFWGDKIVNKFAKKK